MHILANTSLLSFSSLHNPVCTGPPAEVKTPKRKLVRLRSAVKAAKKKHSAAERRAGRKPPFSREEENWMGAYFEKQWGREQGEPPIHVIRTMMLDAHKHKVFRASYEEHQVRSFCRRCQKHRALE